MATKNYSELRGKMSLESQRWAEREAQLIVANLQLEKLKQAAGSIASDHESPANRTVLAISDAESDKDIGLASLGQYVVGLGYSLEVNAVGPDGQRHPIISPEIQGIVDSPPRTTLTE